VGPRRRPRRASTHSSQTSMLMNPMPSLTCVSLRSIRTASCQTRPRHHN
jgi:hypothetical protein